jgi:hypothetical protein
VVEGLPAAGAIPSAEGAIGSFPAPDGTPLTLVRTPVVAVVGAPAGRPATLEEIVIGHLAAGRNRAAAAAEPGEGAAA